MKAKNIWLWVLAVIAMASCKYDDGELWDKVNSLDERVTNLEETVKKMNSDFSAMKTIIEAMENRIYVSSLTSTNDGYIIEFSNGQTATITNGKDAPIISISKDSDGKYYWVQKVNGTQEWILDEEGNKMPVSGKDAVTPQLKVNASGFWIVSYDNGVTFTEILDEAGQPVKAVGKDGQNGLPGTDGDSFFSSVEVKDGYLILVLSGHESEEPIRIPIDNEAAIGISDSKATANPAIEGEPNVNIPNFSSYLEEGSDDKVMCLSLTGIQTPDNDWMALYGTEHENQNIWVEIDGKPKAVSVVNSSEVVSFSRASFVSKAKADIVFLVDNSGSMSQEANAVAREILEWSAKISQTMDVKFGCVGHEYGNINGALNITDVNSLNEYLNRTGVNGTRRTMGFEGSDKAELANAAAVFGKGDDESGGLMLHFADEYFNFREGANRIYIHFTDEPNQPGGVSKWSVETVNVKSEYYNWNVSKGTIHTVFSDLYGYPEDWSSWKLFYREKSWLFSEYTGGTTIRTDASFADVSLDDLPVTGAITNSYILRINVTPDLLTGTHTVKITILSKDGTVKAEQIFTDVKFGA